MSDQPKLKPMPDFAFRMMVWTMRLEDLFRNPADLLKQAPLRRGMVVVDYACGPGRYTIPAAEMVGPEGKVYAVDIQPLAIEMVKKKAMRRGMTNVLPVLVDSFNTGIPEASADMVLLIDAIYPIKERKTLFHEVWRLMKPDGLLFMDSSHMKPSQARGIVEGTRLFVTAKAEGRNMLLARKTQ